MYVAFSFYHASFFPRFFSLRPFFRLHFLINLFSIRFLRFSVFLSFQKCLIGVFLIMNFYSLSKKKRKQINDDGITRKKYWRRKVEENENTEKKKTCYKEPHQTLNGVRWWWKPFILFLFGLFCIFPLFFFGVFFSVPISRSFEFFGFTLYTKKKQVWIFHFIAWCLVLFTLVFFLFWFFCRMRFYVCTVFTVSGWALGIVCVYGCLSRGKILIPRKKNIRRLKSSEKAFLYFLNSSFLLFLTFFLFFQFSLSSFFFVFDFFSSSSRMPSIPYFFFKAKKLFSLLFFVCCDVF